ncbi:M14 family zinc carboxypeptidase [Humisphaera borealis]|uniref:DUF2817 domain-containing protein n=1 Tax=Humisphaera borealis TaxID=2807512 RepID=A0A7M2WU29_9BACT|nr:M14 family zinc carboxypeptidase [Humisphaera borealis]QOV88986.1 DUF2817 domain-containing protein [Humisphaera borealis]
MNPLRHGRRLAIALFCAATMAGCSPSPGTIARPTPPMSQPATTVTVPPRVVTLGHSIEARPIVLHLFGDTAVGPANTVLIFGGIHGNEPTSAGVCRELVAYLTANPDAWQGRCVAILPEANPDGLNRRIRTNKNLIDLNRNFPAANWKKTRRSSFFGGDAPATEPETKVLISLIEQNKPARIVSVHSMADPCNNYDGPGEALAERMAKHNGYPVKASIGYPTPGSFGSWAGGDKQIPVITLELPSRATTEASWKGNREALLAAVRG